MSRLHARLDRDMVLCSYDVSRARTVGLALRFNPLRWRLGFQHLYYDGPHHSIDIGPLCVFWDPRECLRCESPTS